MNVPKSPRKDPAQTDVNAHLLKQLDAIINSSYDGLWICNREGRVVRINKASERINSIRAEDILNRRMEDLVVEGFIDRSVTLEVFKNRIAVTIIQQLKNGKELLVTGNPVLNEEGEIELVVVNERDITELNRLRSELGKNIELNKDYRRELSLRNCRDLFPEVITRSDCMQKILELAMKVAHVDAIVMLQGETGVGKGLLAKLIHRASPRKEGPFIRVDCAAVPETLIESELFGYEPGAFTGALAKGKRGQFELAEGGTLFLDEIGSLPVNAQVKLLRFIEDHEVVPVGGSNPKSINARIICASNNALEKMTQDNSFRKDLFFRLNVIPIEIPPLRNRVEDIPALVNFFLQRYNLKCGAKRILLPEALDQICSYSFPGNIRELSNLMERLVIMSPNDKIAVQDLPSHVRSSRPETKLEQAEWDLKKATESIEVEIIRNALKKYGNQRNAARAIGIDQSTLARKIKRYRIKN